MTHKVAVLEDDEILSKVLREELKDAGFKVVYATDGEAGLKLVRKEKPDLVLSDILMPKKTGFEVLEEIKADTVTKQIPFIMLTMLGADDDIKKGLKLGANDYIVKSQHAVAEICEKVQEFFGDEAHPEASQSAEATKDKSAEDKPKSIAEEADEKKK